MNEWTVELVRADADYRRHGTLDVTSRRHLREARAAHTRWWHGLVGRRGDHGAR
ncbi:hypothetical protein [Actinokineospora enzanensis]|uniref:hypothetical protein n=1 Tax=Actinokineospora enzanensis TaxID=155975 RepID=UPI0003766BC4|nr:hypothetical protein [Actinokineospora enzanensis]